MTGGLLNDLLESNSSPFTKEAWHLRLHYVFPENHCYSFTESSIIGIWTLLKLTIGLKKQVTEKVQNCYKEINVKDNAFFMKILMKFEFTWVLSVMQIIMRQREILIALTYKNIF